MLDFKHAYYLENERVRLSPLKLEHLESLQQPAGQKSIWTYFLEKGHGSKQFKKYIEMALANRSAAKEYPFVIFDKIKNKYAGMTRLYDWNEELRNLKIGHTWIGKDFQGTGVNKNCKYLLFEFAFEHLKAVRIGFGVHAENIRSLRALHRIGVKKEGILRDFLPEINGSGRKDLILLSILKDEWFQTIKEDLLQQIK
ncbi:MAG: GNAT family protein [Bacteroidota bacterium]